MRAILLKGPAQQQWLAAAGPPRASVDVDLLVPPDQAGAAGQPFFELGYRVLHEVTPGIGHHAFLWTAPRRIPVEVHSTLWGTGENVWNVLEHETETVVLAGESVEVPNEPARCLVVALHAAHHGVGADGALYDLERAVRVGTRETWARAAHLAGDVGGVAAFAAGLDLVQSGKRLRTDLGLAEPELTNELALALASPTAGAAGYYWFSRQKGVRARSAFVLRKVVPPASFMRYKHRFARRGRAHLVLTYVYRPFWLARWAIPGLLEWRRIRSAARSDRRTSG